MRITLVRHPKPIVAANICYGSSDLAIADDELTRVSNSLSITLPQTAALFSSPLRRCAELAARLNYPSLQFDARLTEMHFGAWEMRSWDEIPRTEIDAWASDLIHYRPGDGESVLQMATRVAGFYADIQNLPDDEVIIICHAGTIRLLTACHQHAEHENNVDLSLSKIARHAATTRHRIPYGTPIILER
ncbi:phosphoglycerate mutase [Glaciimonas sp. GS1]|uniref:Phosphoglycerate mutase n=2 Tax=Glaciimonas soli TaxID=2590999 RepID=A0A843YWH0_9BURK|nr:phosphoglycerate mutase [Glaciimonas soli]